MTTRRLLAYAQGAFYVGTGVWPLVNRRTFEAVTGPKTDWWLVQTVGILVTGIGATLLLAARRDDVDEPARLLGAASALGLAGIDVVHVTRGRISKVYLLDAAAELVVAAGWGLAPRAAA